MLAFRAVAVLACLLTAACSPPCGQLCRKVLDCGLGSERVSYAECTLACEQQEALYNAWDNAELQALYVDHKQCVAASSCDDLAAGACYEGYEALFVF